MDVECATVSLRPGTIVDGKYRVVRALGVGVDGDVFLVTRLDDGARFALERIRPATSGGADERFSARFLEEARPLLLLRSKHVARVHDIGSLPDGWPYLVLDRLEGEYLMEHAFVRELLPLDESAAFTLEACAALAEAHARGIVHGDLGPPRLFLARCPDGGRHVKVLRMGMERLLLPATSGFDAKADPVRITISNLAYCPPERLRDPLDLTTTTDIWSFGVLLHEMLAGRPAFPSATLADLVHAILEGDTPHLATVRPDLPPEVDAIVACCLERQPERRLASASELAAILAPYARRSLRDLRVRP